MTLAPIWRTRIVGSVAAIIAVWLGWNIAQQEFAWPVLFVAGLGGLIAAMVHPQPLPTQLIGVVLIGYIVGNRGFAQLSLAGNLPLLPAELVLLVSCAALVFRSAWERTLPVKRDLLNGLVLLWIVASSVRLYADVRNHGAMALRDYAMVYYAAFFFVAQHSAATASGRRFLRHCLLAAVLGLLMVYPLFVQFPDVFMNGLTFRGAPLIYFKGDLVGTFLAVGTILFYASWDRSRSRLSLALSLALAGAAVATNNRASMLGLIVATTLLAIAGRWRLAVLQGVAGVAAATGLLFVAYVKNEPWESTPVYGVYERLVSLTDPLGQRVYTATEAFNKGDNNLFRAVWWRLVYEEATDANPVLGLGYGYDLAARFVREYYPDLDEFTTRSPHNFLLTVYARTGLVGLVPFVGIVLIILVRTVRAARRDLETGAVWCAAVTILISALFGVVLEGPMGAVIFWTTLGLANAEYVATRERATEAPADLQAAPEPLEVVAPS